MSFSTTSPIDTTPYAVEVDYSFPSINSQTTIYSGTDISFLKSPSTDLSYVQITFTDSGPNVIIEPDSKDSKSNVVNYTASNVYLFGQIHTIDSKKVKGEIIFQLETSNQPNNIYFCFQVSESTDAYATNNRIDNMITMVKLTQQKSTSAATSVMLTSDVTNPLISTNSKSAIYYSSKNGDIVFVCTTPIILSADSVVYFSGLSTDPSKLFTVNTTKYKVASNLVNIFSIPSSEMNDQIYIDCSPIIDSAGDKITTDDIQYLSLPLANAISQQEGQLDFYKTSVNFYLFGIGALFAYFVFPKVYKKIVIDKIACSSIDESQKSAFLSAADYIITGIVITLSYIFYGVDQGLDPTIKANVNLLGVFILIIYVLLASFIVYLRKNDEAFLKSTCSPTSNSPFDKKLEMTYAETQNVTKAFFKILIYSIANAFTSKGYTRTLSQIVLVIITITSIAAGFSQVFSDTNFLNFFNIKVTKFYFIAGFFYIPITLFFFALFFGSNNMFSDEASNFSIV